MNKLFLALVLLLGLGSVSHAATKQPQSLGSITASTSTFTGGINLWNRTAAQIQALIASTTGQQVFCSDCTANGGKGTICVSTGGFTGATLANQFVLSTGTVCK